MALANDIAASYRRPGPVIRRRLGDPSSAEERALVTCMLACFLIFVAQWPRLSREAFLTEQDVQPMIGGALMGWIFIMPLALYALAGISHFVAKRLGGQGTYVEARMALFWALLAATPLWLFWGLLAGFQGPGVALDIVGIAALLAFVLIWAAGLYAVERP
ncbi:Yip1 domain protein [Rhodobacteraceae bacterium THAF1]|uniref:YIP1 family protein n=1 Tax=Palleronia sp. THAF1 TaxID=2587842 RepID=UPI000F3B64D7|nr:YIP1 family protein [Palleronia sp. THAF1]QFU08534.1 Yip1 domain protein [Palleronia sp. THAF1]VDC30584.1 Yip1 domain protein [Rhodobacteraceae bacterium THAF1]